ncbi:MAG: pantoate--beta-alanine ligase [Oscillospiraceae bacterium]|nr:pantoate--beta-alanine ligase [Oscillospiraceae bacterium]
MRVIEAAAEMRAYIKEEKKAGRRIGLVPTMGYLHDGHRSLIEKAASQNDTVIVSVFVNPTQFGAGEDLETYPRDLERDKETAEAGGAKVIFHPPVGEMYPKGYKTYVNVEEITGILCGKSRPTHFRGVTTVVSKLFNIVSPDRAYFGLKDAQQLAVICRMVEDMNFDIEIVPCPIVRESDGLAMSSRNTYLSVEERRQALSLGRGLAAARKLYEGGEKSIEKLTGIIRNEIDAMPMSEIDYIEAVEFPSLEPVVSAGRGTLIALAVKFGNTRLIDNIILD